MRITLCSILLLTIASCTDESPKLGEHISHICLCDSVGNCDPGCGDGEPSGSSEPRSYPYTTVTNGPFWGFYQPGGYQDSYDCGMYVACCLDIQVLAPNEEDYIQCAPSDLGKFCAQASTCACNSPTANNYLTRQSTTLYCCYDGTGNGGC